TFRQGDMSRF
nr:Chain D, GlnR C-tail peptide [Bacillus subtilis]7TFC_E Chain E, GlnR C-tail peptide [Bacillus subtilis]7TFC_J Chain J, GlnR C-tail peptide [Bacillus subtilis]7TFC_K Chain K, GlnR C-tail peptide [Bacillus subtilis]7TFC_L Chain L, GlnR C-tail peptide [Bacillus subtilis]7TFC_M Chain M, GlnR C-tail peptide [Bacillus subtilis]7TFC_U Chain U, GlnR C-tail peptide [Bacillus subtilis]7TFC_V Chain V, GlnR C-tail peptide [Bacillus subtilis]7TFC_W Chain W, GlnR C-tail peptide [Bacillus subtilis]7TF